MAGINRVAMLVKTYGGLFTRVVVCVAAAVIDPSGTVVGALRTAMATCLTVFGYKSTLGIGANVTDTSGNGDYEDIEDKMACSFRSTNGQTHTFYVPSPLSSNFVSPNFNVVDPTDTNVASYISTMLLYGRTSGGEDLVEYLGGKRIRKKTRRK